MSRTMTDANARAYVDALVSAAHARNDAQQIAEIEIVREYLFNPDFRRKLTAHVGGLVWDRVNGVTP